MPHPEPTVQRNPGERRASDSSQWHRRRRLAKHTLTSPGNPVLPTLVPNGSHVAYRADFSQIRYGQCWEDADTLLAGLDVRSQDVCLSLCSAGDNTLALLARKPARVIAVEVNPAQLACLELRVAAYRTLEYDDLLVFMGSRRGYHRAALYETCRPLLSRSARNFWDERPEALSKGLASTGKFERAADIMRRRILPLVHPPQRLAQLLQPRSLKERYEFYDRVWNTWLWRLMFLTVFSRPALSWTTAYDLAAFAPTGGPMGLHVLQRACQHVTQFDPLDNPYAHWLLTGTHGTALPFALRRENVELIRANLDRLEWRLCAIEDVLDEVGNRFFDCFNLGDHFEYLAESAYHTLLYRLSRAGRRGARLVYWNRLVDRRRPAEMADTLQPRTLEAQRLFSNDRTLFASRLVLEDIL